MTVYLKTMISDVQLFLKVIFKLVLEVPAIGVETRSCPLQNVLVHSPDGWLSCSSLLTTNFPLRYCPKTKTQRNQIGGLDRHDDWSASTDELISKAVEIAKFCK